MKIVEYTTNVSLDVIYCKFLSINELLNSSDVYTLTIWFIEMSDNLNINALHVKFFTATSEFKSQYIIDQNPFFGTLGIIESLPSNDSNLFNIDSIHVFNSNNALPLADKNNLIVVNFYD